MCYHVKKKEKKKNRIDDFSVSNKKLEKEIKIFLLLPLKCEYLQDRVVLLWV